MQLDFRCGVGVDLDARLVRVTTVVRLKNRRGRLYFAPIRLVHPIMVMAMLHKTRRRLAGANPATATRRDAQASAA